MVAIPETMKAVVTQEDKTIVVKDLPVPTTEDDEVLVKVTALAQNPTDWKRTSCSEYAPDLSMMLMWVL